MSRHAPRAWPALLAASLLAAAAFAAGHAAAQDGGSPAPRPRRPSPSLAGPSLAGPNLAGPLPVPPIPPPAAPGPAERGAGPRFEPAPVPNRDIEAPRERFVPPTASLEPTLITPETQRRGFTFGREHAPTEDERLFREPAAGARLRVPLP